MLRIEETINGNGKVLRAAGRLTAPWVAEIDRMLASEAGKGAIVLDLTEVSFADNHSLAFLLTLISEARVALRCSPFLTEQLTTASKAKP